MDYLGLIPPVPSSLFFDDVRAIFNCGLFIFRVKCWRVEWLFSCFHAFACATGPPCLVQNNHMLIMPSSAARNYSRKSSHLSPHRVDAQQGFFSSYHHPKEYLQ